MAGLNQGGRRKLTGIVAAAVTAGLLLGAGMYMWGVRNAAQLSDRNLRELARMGRAIEGQVNNLDTVITNVARAGTVAGVERLAAVVPNLSRPEVTSYRSGLDLARDSASARCPGTERTDLRLTSALDALELCYEWPAGSSSLARARARWSLGVLQPDLRSDYFEMTLLADESGTVLLSAPLATGIRVHRLPLAPDTLPAAARGDGGGGGRDVSTIQSVTVAGRPYRIFVQPLRLAVKARGEGPDGAARWRLAGLVPESRFRQEALALGPSAVLALGLMLIVGFLAAPFMRASTMGPRERLRVHHLLFVVASLVLISGGVGLTLADLAHYVRLRSAVYAQVDRAADRHLKELRTEVRDAIRQLDVLTDRLIAEVGAPGAGGGAGPAAAETICLKDSVPRSDLERYPLLTMAFWTSLSGMQVAKWTPRPTNTSLVSVADRDYFTAIRDSVGWQLQDSLVLRHGERTRLYYLNTIRTWTTGEKSAALSTTTDWPAGACGADGPTVVGVVLTRFATLDTPILPPGVSFAVVDTSGKALFHARKERAMEENMLEETGDGGLLRSTLRAHVDRELDVLYRGRRTRLFVRPVPGTPISLVLILDKAQLETVRFEAVFTSATLFAALTLLVFVWLALVEVVVPRKLHWVWPDPTAPGRYFALSTIWALFLVGIVPPVLWPHVFAPHPGHLLVPFQALGLGLAALSLHESGAGTMRRARWFGLGLAVAASALGVVWQLLWPDALTGHTAGSLALIALQSAVTVLAFAMVWLEYSERRDVLQGTWFGRELGPRWCRLRNRIATGPRTVQIYVVAMVLGLQVIGVVPGYLLYQVAFDHQLDLMIRDHEVQTVEALRARSVRADSIARHDHLGAEYREAMDSVTSRLAFGMQLFGICQPAESGTRLPGPFCAPPASDTADAALAPEAERRLLPRALLDRVPFLSEPSVAMRQLLESQPDRKWLRARGGGSVTLRDGEYTLAATLPAGIGLPTGWWLVAFPAGVGLLAWILAWVARRVFLVELWASPPVTLAAALDSSETTGHLLVVCTRSTDRTALRARSGEWCILDLMDQAVGEDGAPVLAFDASRDVLCIDHADHRVRESAWGCALLDFLEHMVYVATRPSRVILLTSQEPDNLLYAEGATPDPGYEERWTRLLGRFTRIAVQDGADQESFGQQLEDIAARLEASGDVARSAALRAARPLLEQECIRPTLQRIGLHIVERYPPSGIARAELVSRIRDEADIYYRALWAVLGAPEKLVIAQLASGAVVNPSCASGVSRLLGRGIIVRGPELRVMNESFARFVRDNAPESVIVEWERAGYASTWELIRLPFVVGWIVVALFLFWTQRDLLGNTIAFLSTAGVGLAAIVRLFALFQTVPGQDKGGRTADA